MLLTQKMVDDFLGKVKKSVPNFVAGVLSDENGFPIASKIPKKLQINEDYLALSTVCKNEFIDFSKYTKIVKDIGRNETIKLLILLKKSTKYSKKFKQLNKILSKQSLF